MKCEIDKILFHLMLLDVSFKGKLVADPRYAWEYIINSLKIY